MCSASVETWTAVATWVTALVLAGTAAVAWWQLAEQFRPWVTVDFHFRGGVIAFIAVKNIGSRPAYQIQLRFEPELVSTLIDQAEFKKVAMLNEPIPVLAPGQQSFTLFDRTFSRLDATDLPQRHSAFVEYRSQGGRRFGPYEFVLDFAGLEGRTLPDKNLHDLVEAVEGLSEAVQGKA